MRCPTCGTENAPDSRFCGGCGKPMPGPGPTSRVAPTAKIPDDAPLAPPTRPAPSAVHPHVSFAPPAMPTPPPGTLSQPPGLSPYQAPPAHSPAMQRPAARAPMASNPSLAFDAPPSRPLGLIALILIIDLGLAASGAFLLAKGLSSSTSPPADTPTEPRAAPAPAPVAAPPAAAPVQKSEVPAPAPAPVAEAARPAATATVARPARKSPEPRRSTSASAPAKKAKAAEPAQSTGPVTSPSAGGAAATGSPAVSTQAELDAQANGSRAAFRRCHEASPGAQGTIDVAFRVLGDGRIANVAVVDNTTGNDELARCLERTISSWKVSSHDGAPLSFVRPFSYP